MSVGPLLFVSISWKLFCFSSVERIQTHHSTQSYQPDGTDTQARFSIFFALPPSSSMDVTYRDAL